MERTTMKLKTQDYSLYYGDFRALQSIDLEIYTNQITAIIGPSGCGKSTLLRSFNRMNDLIPGVRVEGQVLLDGLDIFDGTDVVELRRRVGMVFQKPNPFPKTIFDNVAYGPRAHGIKNRAQLAEIVERSLRAAALWDEVKDDLHKSALALSGGQQQRLCIARALAVEPEVILMDTDAGAKEKIHHRHRHPQHAAGGPGIGLHRLSADERAPRRGTHRVRRDQEHLYQPQGQAHRGLHHRAVWVIGEQAKRR